MPRNSLALRLAGLLLASSLSLTVLAQAPSAADGAQAEYWTINLKDADIREFIDQVAEITGETFIVDPRVKGQVSVVSQARLSGSEAYQLFLSVMATHGFTVIHQDGQARILPNAEAKAEPGSPRPLADQLETRLIQVQHNSVSDLLPLIRPLVPQYGHLAAVPANNSLIISDRRANIARLEELIRQLDRKNENDYSVIDLKHAWVTDAAETLNAAVARGQAGATGTQVIADTRTNRLILLGPPAARAKLAAMARAIDSPSVRSANTRVIRLRHNDAKSLAATLGELATGMASPEGGNGGGGRQQNMLIRADESLNALILLAEPEIVATLESVVRQLDVPRAQVLVEAAIVEVSGDISDALGVQWAVDARGSSGGVGGVNFGNTGLAIGTVLQALQSDESFPTEELPDGAIIGLGSDSFGVLINALSSNSKSNLLSTPSLLTLDNQLAEILVGQNVPFQTGSYTTDSSGAGNPFTTIERQDVGVTLKVTPHINEGATLRLEIEQEISSIAPSASLAARAVDLITNKRAIKSTILAEDGQVVVLGGLIQDDVTRSESKVPLLGDIPLLGRLFRSTKDTHIKRNLMVFLRPSVVRDAAGLAALSGRKYSDIHLLSNGSRSALLPPNEYQLFDGPGDRPVDLREQ
ncbi:MAG TPA: type II secretion system secretin GspD [Pseudomonas sp.]|nr:type II secretion system secretin GspD [Pseudomonas sp.]